MKDGFKAKDSILRQKPWLIPGVEEKPHLYSGL